MYDLILENDIHTTEAPVFDACSSKYGGGAKGDDVTDNTARVAEVLDAAHQAGGGIVKFSKPGHYRLDNLQALEDYVAIEGVGRGTWLKAGSNDVQLVRLSAGYGGIRGVTLDGGGFTGVQLLSIVPPDEADLLTAVQTSYNYCDDLWLRGGAEGIVLRTGPVVGAVGSGAYYNEFHRFHVFSCIRGIWLRDTVDEGEAVPLGSPANRNHFIGGRVGQNCNTGVQIDSADTCRFIGVDFEGVNDFVSPNATPTAIIVNELTAAGYTNAGNSFIGCRTESCTRDVENHVWSTRFIDCPINPAAIVGTMPMIVGGERNQVIAGTMSETQHTLAMLASEANKTVRDFTADGNGCAWDYFARMLGEFHYGVIYKSTTGTLSLHESHGSGANMSLNVSGQLLRASNAVASPRTISVFLRKRAE